jgi:predicted RNA-binding protein with PUA domain
LFTRRTIVQILFVNIEELAIQNKSKSNGAEVIHEKSTDWTHIRPSAATLRKAGSNLAKSGWGAADVPWKNAP